MKSKFNSLNDKDLRRNIGKIYKIRTRNMSYREKMIDGNLANMLVNLYCKDKLTNINTHINWSDTDDCYEAVMWNGLNLQYVKRQYKFLCESAVNADGMALQYVKRQTPELCEVAVNNDGLALQFVKKQTPEICEIAVRQNGLALEYVKNQTEDICLLAITQNPRSFRFVKDKTVELSVYAIDCDHYNLRYSPIITPYICKVAIDADPLAIFHIHNPPPELCLYAIKKDLRCIGSVKFMGLPDNPIRYQLDKFLTMARLKFGTDLNYNDYHRQWYLSGYLHDYGMGCGLR